MLGIIINAYAGSSDRISFIKAAIGDINSNRHSYVLEMLDVLQMLEMFSPLNADDCCVAKCKNIVCLKAAEVAERCS